MINTTDMEDISKILADKSFKEPAEIKIIKDFVKKHFDSEVSVRIHSLSINIAVESASLAAALNQALSQLKEELSTDKKLFITIN